MESQSDHVRRQANNFFAPSAGAVVLYILLSVILLVLLNYGTIIERLSSSYIDLPQTIQANLTTFSHNVSGAFSSALGGRLGQIILWSIIGAVAYIILWMIKNLFNSFENDIISDGYLHPSSYNRLGYWGSSLSVKVLLFATVLITIGFSYISLAVILPSAAALSGSAVYNFQSATSLAYIFLSVALGAFLIYIFVLLLRLIARLWRLL